MTVFRWAPQNSFVAQIDQLFELEADAKRLGYSLEQRLELRRRRSVPILESIRAQIQTARQNALPKSSLAKACDYTLTLWNRLIRFLDNPVLELSNNWAENAIRPVALGRNYEQLGIRQSLTRAKRDSPRWALNMADDAASPVFA
jgi:hypothetical protein